MIKLQRVLADGVTVGKNLTEEFQDKWTPKQPAGRVKVLTKVCSVIILALSPNCKSYLCDDNMRRLIAREGATAHAPNPCATQVPGNQS